MYIGRKRVTTGHGAHSAPCCFGRWWRSSPRSSGSRTWTARSHYPSGRCATCCPTSYFRRSRSRRASHCPAGSRPTCPTFCSRGSSSRGRLRRNRRTRRAAALTVAVAQSPKLLVCGGARRRHLAGQFHWGWGLSRRIYISYKSKRERRGGSARRARWLPCLLARSSIINIKLN